MPTRRWTFAVLLTLMASAAVNDGQQPQPSISGIVVDINAGFIPGATIRLSTGDAPPLATTVTNERGAYSFPPLAAGTYRVEFSLQGFRTVTCADVLVKDGAAAVVSTFLEIAALHTADGDAPGPSAATTAEPEPAASMICLGSGEVPVFMGARAGDDDFYLVIVVDTVKAPKTSASFLRSAAAKAYDRGQLARVPVPVTRTASGPPRDVATSPSVIEGRTDPKFTGPPPTPLPLESTIATGLRHRTGTISMARGESADSGAANFIVLLADDPSFDAGGRRYADRLGAAAFGRVVRGLDGLRKLGSTPASISSARVMEPFIKR